MWAGLRRRENNVEVSVKEITEVRINPRATPKMLAKVPMIIEPTARRP